MAKKSKITPAPGLTRSFALPSQVTLGSAVRAQGICLELRARLSPLWRSALGVSGATLTLDMPKDEEEAFTRVSAMLSRALDGIESLPVIPREIEDILAITTSERRRWLEDGRLPSGGTKTIALRGRARAITFHVFDPRMVEAVLESGAVEDWREADALAKIEKRQEAAYRAKLTRSLKKGAKTSRKSDPAPDEGATRLKGWDEFRRDGLLR